MKPTQEPLFREPPRLLTAGHVAEAVSLRPYQSDAAGWLSKRKRGMVIAPAGSGKTIIVAAALDIVLSARKRTDRIRVGWIANTREQVQQAKDALALFPRIASVSDVTVSCQQAGLDWTAVSLLIVDECHHATAPEWLFQIETCQAARWGMTATPDTGDWNRDKQLRDVFGNEVFIVDRGEIATNLSPATVLVLSASDYGVGPAIDAEIPKVLRYRQRFWSGDPGQLYSMVAWQVCVQLGIVGNQARTAAAVATARKHLTGHVLMLVNQVEHAHQISEQIPGAVACHSTMGAKKRDATMSGFKSGKIGCIVATSLCDEGADIPIADTLILVSGGRSSTKTEQRTGRVLRKHDGKTGAVIYDFADDFHKLMAKHFQKRLAIYRKLGYKIDGELGT